MKPSFLLVAAAALTLAACGNDENLNDGPVPIRLSSSLEVQTRAATDIQGNAFDANEKVDVFIMEDVPTGQTATTVYDQPLVYTTGGNGAMNPTGGQPYFPTSGNGVNIYAYYPVDVAYYIEDTETIEFTVKPDQSTEANYKASDLMFAKAANPVSRTANAVPLTFTHLLSKVTIILEAGAGLEEADLIDAKVELLDVKPKITLTTISGSISAAEGEPTNITVFTAAEGALSGSAIIVPQELPARFVRVTLDDGGVLVGTLSGNSRPDLKSGNAYIYTITVNLTGLNITVSIKQWTDNEGSGSAVMEQ